MLSLYVCRLSLVVHVHVIRLSVGVNLLVERNLPGGSKLRGTLRKSVGATSRAGSVGAALSSNLLLG